MKVTGMGIDAGYLGGDPTQRRPPNVLLVRTRPLIGQRGCLSHSRLAPFPTVLRGNREPESMETWWTMLP